MGSGLSTAKNYLRRLPATCLLLMPGICLAQASIPPGLSQITPEDAAQASIAFINISVNPGLAGAVYNVDNQTDRNSELIRTSLGFGAEFTLRNTIMNGYWGLAITGGQLEDDIRVQDDLGNPVDINIRRRLASLRGSAGLVFPVTESFRIRPYATLALSHLDNDSVSNGTFPAPLPETFRTSKTDAYTGAATIEALYDKWYGSYRLEVSGMLTALYTNTFNYDTPLQDFSGWNETLSLTARWGGELPFSSDGKPWRWNIYSIYNDFLNQPKKALGFTRYVEAGAAVEWEWTQKPLDWFGIRFLGFKVGVIQGDDVDGYSIGLTFR